ncbi:MAG: DNA translocase FtsK [Chloroflexi bacterium]|nr:DNA translocase FtsK [Chloroflexota bacterium]
MADKATSKKDTASRSSKPTDKKQPDKGIAASIQKFLEDPYAFEGWQEKMPSWSDEVGGLALITIGILTFAALINPAGEAALSTPLANSLLQWFGLGAFVVALTLLALGVIFLLPKIGITIKFNWVRIVAMELAFVSLEGLFHLLSFSDEGRALARAGKGGGYVGWTISSLLTEVTRSSTISIAVLSMLLLYSLTVIFRISRRDLRYVLLALGNGLQALSERMQREAPVEVEHPVEHDPVKIEPQPSAAEVMMTVDDVLDEIEAAPHIPPDETPVQTESETIQSAPVNLEPDGTPAVEPSRRNIQPPTNLPRQAPPPQLSMADSVPVVTSEDRVDAAPEKPPVAEEKPVDTPLPEDDGEDNDFKTMIINGEEVKVPVNSTTVPTPIAAAPVSLAQRRTLEGKRYFHVDGFQDRYIWSDKRDITLPPLELLNYADLKLPTEDEVNTNARIIENTMGEFDIDADVIDVRVGPTVTQYAVSPVKEIIDEEGNVNLIRTRVSKIANLSSDLALALSTKRLRIQAPVPGFSYVGIEVPNREPSIVSIRSVMETEIFFRKMRHPLAVPLGRDVSGDPVVADLASMPHLLVAGTTGSGKSVCLTAMITSLILNNGPKRVRLILLDPKMVELTRFAGLPHLLGPVETDIERIIGVLRWAAREMDRRYKLLEMENARHLEAYNDILGEDRQQDHLPYIVIAIDEIGDLMMSRPDETEKTLTRLAQKARAAGMHLIVATQRPSVDVITGLIKANFPARISFSVASGVDSRVILDTVGAETLIGRGDMLFLAPDAAGPTRLQGCLITDPEIEEILLYWQAWEAEQIETGAMPMPEKRVAPWEQSMTRLEALSKLDPILEEALQMVVAEGRASVSQIQKRMGIDYPRAARIMDSLLELGIIGGTLSGGANRKVLVNSVEEARRMIHNNRRRTTE